MNPYNWRMALWLVVAWNPVTIAGYYLVSAYQDFVR